MRPIISTPFLGLALILFLVLNGQAQEKSDKVSIKITREIDGENKTFEKTYHSEAEMEADEELKEYLGSEDEISFFFGDKPRSFEWNDDKNGGKSFFFNFGDDESSAHNFHFFQDGDSTMKEFDFQMGMLDEHLKDIDIKISKSLEGFKNGEPFAFSFGDDSNFMFHFDDSLADELSVQMKTLMDDVGELNVVIKKVKISEDVEEFGKKAQVKSSEKLKLDDLSYYPNPAVNGKFKLKFKVELAGELEIKIYNLDGKTIFNRYFENFGGQFSETIDLSQQKAGVYLLEINKEGKRLTRKIAID